MSQFEKKLRKLQAGGQLPWSSIIPILETFGCHVQKPGSGSHWKVSNKAGSVLTIPVHSNHIKAVYVKFLVSMLEEDAQ